MSNIGRESSQPAMYSNPIMIMITRTGCINGYGLKRETYGGGGKSDELLL
jgi:hypothetical protein